MACKADCTRWRVSSDTLWGSRNTLETVIGVTPARCATSARVVRPCERRSLGAAPGEAVGAAVARGDLDESLGFAMMTAVSNPE